MAKIIKFNKDYENCIKGRQIIILLTELERYYSKISNVLSNAKRISKEEKTEAMSYFQTITLNKISVKPFNKRD